MAVLLRVGDMGAAGSVVVLADCTSGNVGNSSGEGLERE